MLPQHRPATLIRCLGVVFVCALLPRIILKFLLETRDVIIKNNLFPVSLFLLERPLWLVVKLDIGFLY